VSSVIAPSLNSIAMDDRGPVQSVAAVFVALGYRARMVIHIVSDLLELRFAQFAGVPYQSPVSRRQWEDLWETETAARR